MREGNEPHFDWPLSNGEPAREVWYSLVTRRDADVAFWYRYTLISTGSGEREGRIWAGLTDAEEGEGFFTSEAFDIADVSVDEPFSLSFDGDDGGGGLTYEGAEGDIDTDVADVSWSFGYEPDDVMFTPLRSERLTDLAERFLGSGRHWSANESVSMDGSLEVDGREYVFEDAPGHQGHTVGASSPEGWSWIHCNSFDDPGVCIEALSVEGKTSLCFRSDGEVHMLNRLKHVVGPKANESVRNEPGYWRIRAKGEGVDLEATVEVDDGSKWRKAAYLTPDGTTRYVAHSSITPIEVRYHVEEDGDWSESRTVASDAARAEWADTSPPVGDADGYSPQEYVR